MHPSQSFQRAVRHQPQPTHKPFTEHSQRTQRALTDPSQRIQKTLTHHQQRTHKPFTLAKSTMVRATIRSRYIKQIRLISSHAMQCRPDLWNAVPYSLQSRPDLLDDPTSILPISSDSAAPASENRVSKMSTVLYPSRLHKSHRLN